MEETSLQQGIKNAYESERWVEVIELVSQTDWRTAPLTPFEAEALTEALFRKNGTESQAFSLSKKFIEFYGDVSERKSFEGIRGRYQKWRGDSLKSDGKYQEALEYYESAISWMDNLPTTKQNTVKLIEEVKALIREENEKAAAARRAREQREAAERSRLAQSIGDVGGMSSALVAKLNESGITTLGDLKNAGVQKIDSIAGIGAVTLSQIKEFKSKHNL